MRANTPQEAVPQRGCFLFSEHKETYYMADEQNADTQDNQETPDVDALQARIAELTEENEALTKSNEELTTERDEFEASLQLSQDDVAAKDKAYAELSNTRAKENLLIDAGLPRTLAANITGETEDDWAKSVKAFSDLKASGETPKRDPAQSADNTPTCLLYTS